LKRILYRERGFFVAILLLVVCVLTSSHSLASPEELAEKAKAFIRPGVSKAKKQLAIELLIGLGLDAENVKDQMALSADPIQRTAALEILSCQTAKADHYLPFLDDPSYLVRAAALEGIQNAKDGNLFWDAIVPLLNDPFWPVRSAALKAMAAHAKPGSAKHFFKALKDPDDRVRDCALRFFAELHEDIDIEPLQEAIEILSSKEQRIFVKASLPLVRKGNLAFFQNLAEEHQEPSLRILARFVCTGFTQTVPEAWISDLIDGYLGTSKDITEATQALLSLTGEKVVPYIRLRLEGLGKEGIPRAEHLLHLLSSLLKKKAIPYLAEWTLDKSLPMESREACLNNLVLDDYRERAQALVDLYQKIEPVLQKQAVSKAYFLVQSPHAKTIEPMLIAALENKDPQMVLKAFSALCLIPDPPVDLLIQVFLQQPGCPAFCLRRTKCGPPMFSPWLLPGFES